MPYLKILKTRISFHLKRKKFYIVRWKKEKRNNPRKIFNGDWFTPSKEFAVWSFYLIQLFSDKEFFLTLSIFQDQKRYLIVKENIPKMPFGIKCKFNFYSDLTKQKTSYFCDHPNLRIWENQLFILFLFKNFKINKPLILFEIVPLVIELSFEKIPNQFLPIEACKRISKDKELSNR